MKLATLFADHQKFHSTYQIDNFIVGNSGVTPWGRYKQALRELHSRYRTFKRDTIELSKVRAELGNTDTTPLERVELQMREEDILLGIEDRLREFNRFFAIAAAYKEIIGDVSNQEREKLEREEWIAHIKKEIALDVRTDGKVSRSTVAAVHSLPLADRQEIVKYFKNPRPLLDWHDTLPDIDLDISDRLLASNTIAWHLEDIVECQEQLPIGINNS